MIKVKEISPGTRRKERRGDFSLRHRKTINAGDRAEKRARLG